MLEQGLLMGVDKNTSARIRFNSHFDFLNQLSIDEQIEYFSDKGYVFLDGGVNIPDRIRTPGGMFYDEMELTSSLCFNDKEAILGRRLIQIAGYIQDDSMDFRNFDDDIEKDELISDLKYVYNQGYVDSEEILDFLGKDEDLDWVKDMNLKRPDLFEGIKIKKNKYFIKVFNRDVIELIHRFEKEKLVSPQLYRWIPLNPKYRC